MSRKAVWTTVLALVFTMSSFSIRGQENEKKPAKSPGRKPTEVVALVNGEAITRTQLADELISAYGTAQLDLMINRKIVELACREGKVEVTEKEIDDDIASTLAKLRMKPKEFVQTVLDKQNITLEQYRRDRVWPKLAMVKLVKPRVKVSEDDLKRGFEATYGNKVECRMLVVQEMSRARELWEQLMEVKGEDRLKMFEDHCKTYSIDPGSRPYGGKVAPFNRHSSNPDLEKVVFGLKEGELSSIMQMAGGHVIFLCVRQIPPVPNVTMETVLDSTSKQTVREALHEGIFTKKLQYEADVVFAEAKKKARIENFLNNDFSPEALNQIASPPAEQPTKRR
jgi:hypothetical protein